MKRRTKQKTKIVAFLLLLTVGLLLPAYLSGQEQHGRPGGLFGENTFSTSNGLMDRSQGTIGGDLNGQTFGFGATSGNITGQTFGAPLGSGLIVLLAAGAGYATLKTKKTQKQNRKGK